MKRAEDKSKQQQPRPGRIIVDNLWADPARLVPTMHYHKHPTTIVTSSHSVSDSSFSPGG